MSVWGKWLGGLGVFWFLLTLSGAGVVRAQDTAVAHTVQPGETWAALAAQTGTAVPVLQQLNPHMNRQRQPTIGDGVWLPNVAATAGQLVRIQAGGVLATAVAHNLSPWQLALQNEPRHPYAPLLYHALLLPGSQPVRELPAGFTSLELSQSPARPGQAVGVRGIVTGETAVSAQLGANSFPTFSHNTHIIGLTAVGAFFGNGAPELLIQPAGQPAWVQPWRFIDPDQWTYQQLTLTGAAAEIDQTSIQLERERLFAIWQQATPQPQFSSAFRLPIDSYLEISSDYGVRRSYNGGPYRTYHEGVDFSAYGGTAVLAPATGTVVVAETLYVRGGAVIIDHGLGIYSGFYHLSSVNVSVGDAVQPGQIVGEVGTTGLSTGNHLHWDLLVNATWVDGAAWLDQGMAEWVLTGWGANE